MGGKIIFVKFQNCGTWIIVSNMDIWGEASGRLVMVYYPLAFKAEGVLSSPVSIRPSVRPSVRELYPFRTITRHRFELESPNLHQTRIMGWILSVSIENKGHWHWPLRSFWPFWLWTSRKFGCSRINLNWIWARITKLAPNMHLGVLSDGIENGSHWPWSSMPFAHFDPRNDIQRHSCTLI